jgi:hypothetical protein
MLDNLSGADNAADALGLSDQLSKILLWLSGDLGEGI